ncbi:MAG: hypothetical protein M3M99_03330 [Actinomycetota bacterium]|nr:hypothetical protein [Actinomycetota bacterium]
MTTLESTSERLENALRRLAVEAADLFEELLASGAELPFEIEPSDDGPLPMYHYAPMTGEFISRHIAELRRLEAFIEVRELSSEEVATGFLTGLWEGRSEFDVAGDRLKGAIAGVLASIRSGGGEGTPAGEVIVPLVGFHMPAEQIELDGVRIVRADSVADAPVDAVEATRHGVNGKAGFLACVSCGFANIAPAAAVADDLQRALRTIRLFRPGSTGLGAHGWARRASGWERFGTAAGRPRNGGYRLTGNEAGDLECFARELTERGARLPALSWAISRFDLGAERASLIEALSDYLLALRGLLEGGGPANVGLSARVAALACEPGEREAARVCVERALVIERKLMSGARYRPAADASPLAVIAELEELLRRILKGLATGELAGDLRASADEILLADGLRGLNAAAPAVDETAEWQLPDPSEEGELDLSGLADANVGEIEVKRASDAGETPTETTREACDEQPTTRIVVTDVELPEIMGVESDHPAFNSKPSPAESLNAGEDGGGGDADWFSSADGELEWPAFARPRRDRDAEQRRGETSDQVRYLFPVPDATDWDVGELRYDDKRRQGH